MYRPLNQYHVVLEADPRLRQGPDALANVYVHSSNGTEVPLSAFTHYLPINAPLQVNHQGQYPAVTISFNLALGGVLGDATRVIETAKREIGMPPSVQGSCKGPAALYPASPPNLPTFI